VPAFGSAPLIVGTENPASGGPDAITSQTVARMAQLVNLSRTSDPVVRAALEAVRPLRRGADSADIAGAVFDYVKSNVEFVLDEQLLAGQLGRPDAGELLIAPWILLGMPRPMGDCDDFSTLTASLLACLGIPCEFVTVATEPYNPGRFSHVYCQAVLPCGARLPLDTSHGSAPGWEVPKERQYRRQVWPLMYLPKPGSKGMGDFDWGAFAGAALQDSTTILKTVLPITLAPAGGVVQTSATGTTVYNPGNATGTSLLGSAAGSSSNLLLIGGAALLLILVVAKR
jgi:hypothetical protein